MPETSGRSPMVRSQSGALFDANVENVVRTGSGATGATRRASLPTTLPAKATTMSSSAMLATTRWTGIAGGDSK
jgi:hypothetical protein